MSPRALKSRSTAKSILKWLRVKSTMKNNLAKLSYLSHAFIFIFKHIIKVIILFFLRGKGDCDFPLLVSLRLGHDSALSVHRTEIHCLVAASLPLPPLQPQKGGSVACLFAKRRSNENRERFSDKKIGTVEACSDELACKGVFAKPSGNLCALLARRRLKIAVGLCHLPDDKAYKCIIIHFTPIFKRQINEKNSGKMPLFMY